MRKEERDLARKKLDKEMRFYRLAARERNCTLELLRTVRHVLGVPLAEVARELGVNRSVILRLEQSEERGTISLNSMERVASAMGCKFVYAIVPLGQKTLEEIADRRKWTKLLADAEGGTGD
jgi:transcriptional regulator with XRE-family HTH domain